MKRIVLALGLALLGHGVAAAQSSPCRAPAAAVGAEVRGPVLHIIDGHTLCVATTADPTGWVRLELAEAPRASTWAELMSVGFGKDVVCTVGSSGATCVAGGRSLVTALQGSEVRAASAAWRPTTPPMAKVRMAAVD